MRKGSYTIGFTQTTAQRFFDRLALALMSTFERRRSLAGAGRVEVTTKHRLDRYEAITRLLGLLTNLNHQLAWISRDDRPREQQGRVEMAQQIIRQLRGDARTQVANVGPEVFEPIVRTTDVAAVLLETVRSAPAVEVARVRGEWLTQLELAASGRCSGSGCRRRSVRASRSSWPRATGPRRSGRTPRRRASPSGCSRV